MQAPALQSKQRSWLLPIVVGVGGVFALKQYLHANPGAQAWVTRQQHNADADEFWTKVVIPLYAIAVAITFYVGYKHPAMRPALLAWYLF